MSNHVHQQMSYQNGATKLSHFMRVAHGTFGMRFNRAFNRSGKVANDRPKTPLIGGTESDLIRSDQDCDYFHKKLKNRRRL